MAMSSQIKIMHTPETPFPRDRTSLRAWEACDSSDIEARRVEMVYSKNLSWVSYRIVGVSSSEQHQRSSHPSLWTVMPPSKLPDGRDRDPGKRNDGDSDANLPRQLRRRLRQQERVRVVDCAGVLRLEDELLHCAG